MKKYFCYHKHTVDSLLDSCTTYKEYVDYEISLGHTATAFTEHGKPLCWIKKKLYCDQNNIKYVHGVECYLTRDLENKVRDNYHTVLLARNYEGVKEINSIILASTDEDHVYYDNRISFDEFFKLSDNVIKISACLASPLNKIPDDDPIYAQLLQAYDFLEIQPHNCADQKAFNQKLYEYSKSLGKPLIAATDTHSLNEYKAECRNILLKFKHQSYGNEDEFDLTYKTYDQLVNAFAIQNALPEEVYMEAIENTNVLESMIENFELDTTVKYPILYGSREKDREMFLQTIDSKLQTKIDGGIYKNADIDKLKSEIDEEVRVFDKINMSGFMLSMSELITWCRDNGIPIGPGRGSVCGSNIAYITDITDVDPQIWHTVFSRFANEDREEVGDIDIDVREQDRPRIFEYIVGRFGADKTARVAAFGTFADAGAVICICGGLNEILALKGEPPKYSHDDIEFIKSLYNRDPDKAKEDFPEVFYYFDGIQGVKFSQSVHPAGMVISPVTLQDNYGLMYKDGEPCLMLDMDEVHDCGLVKYDFLILKTINIIYDTCQSIGMSYPRMNEIDWNDMKVWKDMSDNSSSIFQMESDYAKSSIRRYQPQNIFEMCQLTACIRPSGASYRDDLMARIPHSNPSVMIDELLKENNGYLIYQCDVIKFLKDICGLSGSEADNVRRAIARKQEDRLEKALPSILEGYCSRSDKPRSESEKEAMEFIQIIKDASSYMFGYNHAIAYCLLGYVEAYLRYYYPAEYITAYLNNAANDDDIIVGTELASTKNISITPPKFGQSAAKYIFHKDNHTISKGIGSIKYLNDSVSDKLYSISTQNFKYFYQVLEEMCDRSEGSEKLKSNQLAILINVDYFSDYGTIPQLTNMAFMYSNLKKSSGSGYATQIPKNSVDTWYYEILKKYSTNIGVNGNVLKTYKITDIEAALTEAEEYVKIICDRDLSIRAKINNQLKYLGYISCYSGKPEDRLKLYISDVKPLKAYGGTEPWAYSIKAFSIGNGKSNEFTVYNNTFNKEPFTKSAIIQAHKFSRNKKGYWILNTYKVLE